jgi:murein DD-endopeptidase MepM/ murein hydrolase activator NlpD
VGNTGNARTTSAHLHFGIYTASGAIDPLLFVKPVSVTKKAVSVFPLKNNFVALRSAKVLNDITAKTTIDVIKKNKPVKVHAVAGSYYRVTTAEGKKGFILKNDLKQLEQ